MEKSPEGVIMRLIFSALAKDKYLMLKKSSNPLDQAAAKVIKEYVEEILKGNSAKIMTSRIGKDDFAVAHQYKSYEWVYMIWRRKPQTDSVAVIEISIFTEKQDI